jgi:hypothetical protein
VTSARPPRALAALLVVLALTALAARPAAAAPVVESDTRVSARASAGIAYGVLGMGVGLVILLLADAAARERKQARAARASVSEEPPLQPGRVVLAGVVETDQDEPPVRITITQQGKEWKTKNGWAHRWMETGRQVEVRPFRLALRGGASIPVEPGQQVFLVDKLDRMVLFEGLRRTRTAELSPGERAVISGVLAGRPGPHAMETAYRGGGSELVLQPPRGGQLLISTEPLEQRHQGRAAFHRAWALSFAVFLGACQLLFAPYTRRLVFGQETQGVIVTKRHYTTKNKSSITHHYQLVLRVDDPRADSPPKVAEDVARSDWDSVKEGDSLPVVTVPAPSAFGYDGQLGKQAGLHGVAAGLGLFGFAGMVVFYFARRAASRPWYERKKVVDDGTGHIVAA